MSDRKPTFPVLYELKKALFTNPGPMSQDIGQSGELLTARLRVALILVLAINPVVALVSGPEAPENWVGMAITLVAVTLTFYVTRLAARERPPTILPRLTSQFDVFVVSIAAVGFIAAGNPIMATNNFIHWSYYLLGIGATCLRHNPRLTLVTTLSAIAEYLGIALFVWKAHPGISSPIYGYFLWNDQVGKMVTMLLMGLLALAIVSRNRQVWERSVRDKLTGLHNRRFFDEFLEFKCGEFSRTNQAFCLALIDVDYFKKINDTLGHEAGDRILTRMGHYVGGSFRSSDVSARWGGEEFAVIVSNCESKEAVDRLEDFRKDMGPGNRDIPVTVSIGVACFPGDAGTAEELMTRADRRLYTAKRNGRNQVVATG